MSVAADSTIMQHMYSEESGRVTVRTIWLAGGIPALFRGLPLRLATVVPAGAIMITVYEFVKKLALH